MTSDRSRCKSARQADYVASRSAENAWTELRRGARRADSAANRKCPNGAAGQRPGLSGGADRDRRAEHAEAQAPSDPVHCCRAPFRAAAARRLGVARSAAAGRLEGGAARRLGVARSAAASKALSGLSRVRHAWQAAAPRAQAGATCGCGPMRDAGVRASPTRRAVSREATPARRHGHRGFRSISHRLRWC